VVGDVISFSARISFWFWPFSSLPTGSRMSYTLFLSFQKRKPVLRASRYRL
jgi:hypothetical protein